MGAEIVALQHECPGRASKWGGGGRKDAVGLARWLSATSFSAMPRAPTELYARLLTDALPGVLPQQLAVMEHGQGLLIAKPDPG